MSKTTPIDPATLPTLDSFMEVNNLQGSPGQTKKVDKEKTDDVVTPVSTNTTSTDTTAATAAKLKADEDAKAKLRTDAESAEEAKKKLEADKKAALDKTKTPELTQAALDALVKKAEEKPETLTAEERQVLIDKNLFEEASSFWEDVERIHGVKVPVEFGDVDPESAEGAALRDRALMDYA